MDQKLKQVASDKIKQVQSQITVGKGFAALGVGVVLYSIATAQPARKVEEQALVSETKKQALVASASAQKNMAVAKSVIATEQPAKKTVLADKATPKPSPKVAVKVAAKSDSTTETMQFKTTNTAIQATSSPLASVAPKTQQKAGQPAVLPNQALKVAKTEAAKVAPKVAIVSKVGVTNKNNDTVAVKANSGNQLVEGKNSREDILQRLKVWSKEPEKGVVTKIQQAHVEEQDVIGNEHVVSVGTVAGKAEMNDNEGDGLTAAPKITEAPEAFPVEKAKQKDSKKVQASKKQAETPKAAAKKLTEKLPTGKAVTGLADVSETKTTAQKEKTQKATGLLSMPLPKEAESKLVRSIEQAAKKTPKTGLLSLPSISMPKAVKAATVVISQKPQKAQAAKTKTAGTKTAVLAARTDSMDKVATLAGENKAGKTIFKTSKNNVTEFKLANGMDVLVIPDHRAPVVTHMVWYRVGAADELPGVSGIAHFLEHLMFKGTDKIKSGEFSKIIARNGGQDNAFTSQDAIAYHQRVAKDRLRLVMEMEADRMRNLKLTEKDIKTERDVILEERRSRTDNNPRSQFREQMDSALYMNHPYGIPVIGWHDEMKKLSRKDALAFYSRYYAPNNAILVVAGDVTPQEVEKLAKEIYGSIKPVEGVERAMRPQEPPHRAARRVIMKDKRVAKATWQRSYLASGYNDAPTGEAEALDLLLKIMASGTTSRIYKSLVIKNKIAASAGGGYAGSALDGGKISFYAIGSKGVPLSKLEEAIDAEIALIKEKGVTQQELDRARNAYTADYVYANDNQVSLARRYGWAKVVGRTVEQVEGWPEMLGKVTTADIQKVAKKYLIIEKSVTGELLPETKVAAKK